MTVMRIVVNGITTYTLGGPDMPQAGVYIGNPHKSPKIKLQYNAYRNTGPHTVEHFEWPDRVLNVGDEVTVKIEAEGQPSEPKSRSTFDDTPRLDDLEKEITKLVAEGRLQGKGPGPLPAGMTAQVDVFCSFCSKHADEVDTLLGGANVYICNECISACQEAIATKPR